MSRTLAGLDWLVIVSYFVASFAIAIYYTRRAGESTSEFFLGGRSVPWWLAGTGMVATTFAADTPLAVTELVARYGIAGNWLWWNMVFGGMLTVFFFARLWRRAGILTDVEFIELRYSGRSAAGLRGFKAVYLGLFMNTLVMGWVNLAMVKVIEVCLPEVNAYLAVAVILAVVAAYSLLSGLMGVTVTDAFQFVLAMTGCIVLALFSLGAPGLGGITGMQTKLPEWAFRFVPTVGLEASSIGSDGAGGVLAMPLVAFMTYVGVQWWASWYPGSEPGGGGYIAQRMMSAKNEKHSLFATLWFILAHYCVRPWPWILTALAALVVLPHLPPDEARLATGTTLEARGAQAAYASFVRVHAIGQLPTELPLDLPDGMSPVDASEYRAAFRAAEAKLLADPSYGEAFENAVNPGKMFPKMMRAFLPVGLYGLLLASFLAAYMSTIATHLNWGTSYLINDLYRRFYRPTADERHLVGVGRLLTVLMGVLSFLATRYVLTSISGTWEAVIAISGGIGLVLIFRWFWWRISAASEITAMLAPAIPFGLCKLYDIGFPYDLLSIVAFTTIAWLAVTYLAPPTDREVLHRFYRRVHPGGPGWARIGREVPEVVPDSGYRFLMLDWLAGCVLVYAALFGVGKLLFGEPMLGMAMLAVALLAGGFIYRDLNRRGWRTLGS